MLQPVLAQAFAPKNREAAQASAGLFKISFAMFKKFAR